LTYKGLVRFAKVSTFQNKFPSLKLSLAGSHENIKRTGGGRDQTWKNNTRPQQEETTYRA